MSLKLAAHYTNSFSRIALFITFILVINSGLFSQNTVYAQACTAYDTALAGVGYTATSTADLITAVECANADADADTIILGVNMTFTDDYLNSDSALPQITNPLTIQNNGTQRTFSRDSGAAEQFRLINNADTLTLDGLTLSGGDVLGSGGAIITSGTLRVLNSIIENNLAADDGSTLAGEGGAIHQNSGGTLFLLNSIIRGNEARIAGGINTNGTSTLVNTVVSGNTETGIGGPGGWYIPGGTHLAVNVTFSGNYAGTVSGGVGSYGDLTILNSVFAGNYTSDIYAYAGTITIGNTLYGTSGGGGSIVDLGGNITGAMPDFIDYQIASYGNPTAAGNFALAQNSQGVDDGLVQYITENNASVNADLTGDGDINDVLAVDINGDARNQNGVDMGAYETVFAAPQTITLAFNGATSSAAEAVGLGNILRVNTSDSSPTESAATVVVNVTGGTATAADYNLTGTITIPAGTGNNALVSIASGITITNDTDVEPDETVQLTLSAPSGASLGTQTTHTHTITNDDVPSCTDQTVSTLAQLNSAIGIYNTACVNGDAMTITLASDITLTAVPTSISNSTTATLLIDGDDHTISGADTYRIFINLNGDVTLENITVIDGFSSSVGSIVNNDVMTVTNSTFSNNSVTNSGGAIYNNSAGILTISNSVFSGNTANNSGGAIYNPNILNIDNTTFSGNSAPNGGGITNQGTTTVSNSTFSGNSATTGNGGGLWNYTGTVIVSNSTFSGNSATSGGGGGLYNSLSATITNSTFGGNSANQGGGLFSIGSSSVLNLNNTILANSITGGDCRNSATINHSPGTSNLIESAVGCGTAGVNYISADPMLDTLTGSPAYFPLLEGSPAVNAGDNGSVGGAITDQAGNARIQQTTVDLGAYESPFAPQTVTLQFDSATSSAAEATGIGNVLRVTTSDTNSTQSAATVTVSVTGGTATAADYTLTGTITIPAGTAHNALVSIASGITITNDTVVEPDETVQLTLSAPAGASLGSQTTHTHTITNDDTATVTIEDVSQNEGNAGITNFTFTATLNNAVQGGLVINYDTSNGTATAGLDYTPVFGGSLTFTGTPGETETFDISIVADSEVEPDETFAVTLNTPSVAGVTATDSATGTILNDDTATVTIEDVSQNEGDAGTTNFTFTATLDNAVDGGLTLNYATSDNTATAPADYAAASGTLTFSGIASETATFTVLVNGDTTSEPDETFTVTLSNPSVGGVTANDTATGTILNDDVLEATFTKTFTDDPVIAGDTVTLQFTITNTDPVNALTGITFTDDLDATLTGLAATGLPTSDVCGAGSSLTGTSLLTLTGGTLAPGADCTFSATLNVPGGAAANDYLNTTSTLSYTQNGVGETTDAATDTLTVIVTTPPGFSKSFSPTSIFVGDPSTMTFTIDNSANSVAATGIDFTDSLPAGMVIATPSNASTTCTGGTITAVAGSGVFSYTGGTVAAGATCIAQVDVTGTVPGSMVNTTGDMTSSLGNSGSATDTLEVAVIPELTLSITEAAISENGGTSNATVTRNTGTSGDLIVNLSSDDASEATVPATVTILDGSDNVSFTVTAVDDAVADGTQTVTITASEGGFPDATDTIDITDDETAGVTITESGGTTDVVEGGATDSYTINLNTVPSGVVEITVTPDAQCDVGAGAGTASILTFTDANPQTVTVTAVDDTAIEGAHTCAITNAITTSGAGEYPTGALTGVTANITDNDNPLVNFANATGTAPEGTTPYQATVVLTTGGTTLAADVTVAINQTPGTATTPADYTLTTTSVTFLAGSSDGATQTVDVAIVDDSAVETGETFTLSLGTITGAASAGTVASKTVTISDNDVPGVTVNPTSGNIIEGGSTTYDVVLTSQPTADVTITLATGSTETTISPNPLIFTNANWDTPQTVTLDVADNALADGTRNATITHTATSADVTYNGITITDYTLTINDDDSPGVTVNPTSLSINEGDNDAYTVILNTQPDTGETVTVTISFDDTTYPEVDIDPVSLTLTFDETNWDTPQTITVSITDDGIIQGNRNLPISHAVSTSGGSYDPVTTAADVTLEIVDNETANVSVSPDAFDVEPGAGNQTYELVLMSQPLGDVTINVSVDNPSVCTISPDTLTFTPADWNTPQAITINVLGADGTSCTISHTASGGGYDGVSITDVTVTIDIEPVPTEEPQQPAPQPNIGVFDPALSKLGLLVPGQTGVIGEQLEWVTTVSNMGDGTGTNITIVDNVDSRLQINNVNAPGASVSINGQTVEVTYASINPGERVQFSIFTTVLQGETVNNTICIAGTDTCATGSAVGELPSTGETPLWAQALRELWQRFFTR